MALPGKRLRTNDAFGSISDNPLTAGSTTFNSNQLVYIPVVSGDHLVITLDPLRQYGDPEIVVVTNHSAAATVATITRGAYGTIARSHPQGTVWVHAAIDEDFTKILTSVTRPADPYRGEGIFETDTNRYVGRSTADVWQQLGLFFDPPACRVFNSANQNLTNNSNTILTFDSERFDTDSMHSTSVNTSRITFNTAGLYLVIANVSFGADNDYLRRIVEILINGTTSIARFSDENGISTGNPDGRIVSTIYKFAVNDYAEVRVFQQNTSGGTNTSSFQASFAPEFMATWIGRGN